MPPKKAGGKVKSAIVAAKEEELAKHVEEMRFEKERERLRNEEFILRQRLEEEEHKLLDDHRAREMGIRNAVAERDRQANYVAREKELTAMLDQRERETQELRAKVLELQLAQTVLGNEKDSAVRRATILTGELEAAQQKLVAVRDQMYAAVAAGEDVATALRAEKDTLVAELAAARIQHESARQEVQRLQGSVEELSAKTAEASRQVVAARGGALAEGAAKVGDACSVDAESTVLLNVLHGEVERFKALAAGLQSDLDRKTRDEEKSSLLVGILNTQLDSVREENKRLHAKTVKAQTEAEALHASVESKNEAHRAAQEEVDRISAESAVAHRQLQLEIGVHKKQIEELTVRLETLAETHRLLQAEHAEVSGRATQREQEDFRANVTMKSELDTQKLELARVAREKQDVEEEAFNYKILTRAEMDGLKGRLRKFQETMERKDRESFETVSVLRAEAAKAETDRQREVNSLQLVVQRLSSDLESTRTDRDRLAAELTEKQARFAGVEKDLYEKLVHMTACHDAKHGELEQARARLAAKEEAYASSAILLNAEKENLRARVEELLDAAQKRRAEHLQHINSVATELTELQARMSNEASQQDARYRREKSRAELAERNVKRMQSQILEMEAASRTTTLQSEELLNAAKGDARELRSELAIAKRTIERLEAAFGDQTGYHQLKELNERLQREVVDYRAQVAHLNSVILAAKAEQDVLGGYKLQRAMDDVERLTRGMRRLERVEKLTLPLFRELRAAAERAGASASLRASLEKYDIQMARLLTVDGSGEVRAVDAYQDVAEKQESGAAAASGATNAAGEPAKPNGMNTTLPAVFSPRPPSGPRSCVIEAFYAKKVRAKSPPAAPADAAPGAAALPALGT